MEKYESYFQVVAYLALMLALILMLLSIIKNLLGNGTVISSKNISSGLLLIMLLLTIIVDSFLVGRTIQRMQKKGVINE